MITRTAALNGVAKVSAAVRVKKSTMATAVVLLCDVTSTMAATMPSTMVKISTIRPARNSVPNTDHHFPRQRRKLRRMAFDPRMSSIIRVGMARLEQTVNQTT